jgi:DNA-binding MarR family transcriptional regulator
MQRTSRRSRARQGAELVWLIGEVFRCTRQSTDEFVRANGITAAQLGILYRLKGEPGLSGAELARRSFISPQAAYVALTTLERKGLITRTADRDNHRIVRSMITPEGKRVLDACLADMHVDYQAFGEVLGPGEMEQLIDLLRRCLNAPAQKRPGHKEQAATNASA